MSNKKIKYSSIDGVEIPTYSDKTKSTWEPHHEIVSDVEGTWKDSKIVTMFVIDTQSEEEKKSDRSFWIFQGGHLFKKGNKWLLTIACKDKFVVIDKNIRLLTVKEDSEYFWDPVNQKFPPLKELEDVSLIKVSFPKYIFLTISQKVDDAIQITLYNGRLLTFCYAYSSFSTASELGMCKIF